MDHYFSDFNMGCLMKCKKIVNNFKSILYEINP